MEFVIDVQGFKTDFNEFVFKELAIIPLGEDVQPIIYLFKPPHDWSFLQPRYKCENSWLTNNYHGIEWQDGDIPYEELEEILRSATRNASKIWVKGLEKQKWINRFTENVCNIETLECPSLAKLHKVNDWICSNHNRQRCYHSNCAASNALVLKTWLIDYFNTPVYSIYKEKEERRF